MAPTSIAVIGGGISGMSAAFHLSRRFPQASIVLLERSAREGGWIRSRRVEVKDNDDNKATMLLEAGPRTLRPNSKAVLELINVLNLQSSLITTHRSSPAAKDRFLHIPGRPGLTRLPASPLSILKAPYTSSIIAPAIIAETFRRSNRPIGVDDESLSEFLARRFGPKVERIFGSAVVHGIYAADSRLISTRAAFPSLYEAEERGRGSVVRGLLTSKKAEDTANEFDLGETQNLLRDAAVFSFTDGMETLPRALRNTLDTIQNVILRSNSDVTALRLCNELNDIEVTLSTGEKINVSHVVSAVPLPKLKSLTSSVSQLPHLNANPMSSVAVVNIVFPPTKRAIHPPGFGYLIPRPEKGYKQTNLGILGTVFDSCSLGAQDIGSPGFTKLTVMLGGPYALNSAHVKIENILSQLQHHLSPINHLRKGARLPWPVYYEALQHDQCIPLPTVGHLNRINELRAELKNGPWKGRLEVIGASVDGVSLGDCILSGKNVGASW